MFRAEIYEFEHFNCITINARYIRWHRVWLWEHKIFSRMKVCDFQCVQRKFNFKKWLTECCVAWSDFCEQSEKKVSVRVNKKRNNILTEITIVCSLNEVSVLFSTLLFGWLKFVNEEEQLTECAYLWWWKTNTKNL